MSNRITMELTPDEVELLKAYRKTVASDERYTFAYSTWRVLGAAAPLAKGYMDEYLNSIESKKDPEQTKVIQFEGGIRR